MATQSLRRSFPTLDYYYQKCQYLGHGHYMSPNAPYSIVKDLITLPVRALPIGSPKAKDGGGAFLLVVYTESPESLSRIA